MKQTIREKCFETNSSSYHTLTIQKIKGDGPRKEIEKGKDIEIDTNINVRCIGDTSCYTYTGRSNYEKAQLLLRFIGSEVSNQLCDIVDESEYTNPNEPEYLEDYYDENRVHHCKWNPNYRDYNLQRKLQKERFYQIPLIQAYVNSIKRYIGEEFNVDIILDCSSEPFYDYECDCCKGLDELLEVEDEDLTNVELLTDKFYDIIFNPEIEMIEECESNE